MTQAETGETALRHAVRERRGSFIALGCLLILIGAVAVGSPHLATLSTELLVGAVLVVGGGAQIVHAFWAKGWSGFLWELVIGLVELFAGLALLAYPIAGVIALTLFLAVTFVMEGVLRMILAFAVRPQPEWIWMLIGGLVSTAVGIMLWAKLPDAGLWAIGLLVGINIAMAGWSLLMIALAAGRPGQEARAALTSGAPE